MGLETPTAGLQVTPLNSARSTFDGQSAVDAMIAAFRNGQVTTADLIDRATKMPALRQQVADVTNPANVAARNKILLENAAQESTATLKAKLELEQNSQLAKIPVEYKAKIQDLYKANFFPPTVSLSSWDSNAAAAVNSAHSTLKEWESEAASANSLNKSIKTGTTTVGGIEVAVPKTPTEKIADAGAVDYNNAWESTYNNPASWVSAGKPKVWRDLYKRPPGTSTIISKGDGTVSVGHVPDSATTPSAVDALTISPRVASSDGKAPSVTLGSLEPGASLVGKPPPTPVYHITEVQGRARSFAESAKISSEELARLSGAKFDPTTLGTYTANAASNVWGLGALEGLKSDELKNYNTAQENWGMGLLRLQSGAAITPKEGLNYAKMYFPQIGDGESTVRLKARLRAGQEKVAMDIINNVPFDTSKTIEDLDAQAKDVQKLSKPPAGLQSVTLGGNPAQALTQGGIVYVRVTPTKTNAPAPLKVIRR